MSENYELTISKVIPASAKTLFEAWLDPKALARFMKPMDGMPDCDVKVDAKVGGKFLFVMKVGDQEMPHRGEYKTIQPYEKLVFTWSSEHTSGEGTVTLTFEERSPNETELVLHHVGLPSDDASNSHKSGWGSILDELAGITAQVA